MAKAVFGNRKVRATAAIRMTEWIISLETILYNCYNDYMQKSSNFATDIADELKKVSWPTRSETIRLTIIVIAISLIIGVYIGIIDVLLTKALEIVTKFR